MNACPHPESRRRTVIRSRLGTVIQCEVCGQSQLLDENDKPVGFNPFAGLPVEQVPA